MSEETPYYSSPDIRLQQADLVRGVRAFQLSSFDGPVPVGKVNSYEYAVVVSQDCDLEQDFAARGNLGGNRNSPDKLLFSIIFCGAYPESALKAGKHREGAAMFSSKEWKQVVQNKQPRYQFLGNVPFVDEPLIIDFKDYFFVPGEFVYSELKDKKATRLTNIREPWRDHILQRFGFYLIRVGLPVEFDAISPPAPVELEAQP